MLPRQFADSTLRRMYSLQQIVERQASPDRDHDLSIQYELPRLQRTQAGLHLREIARQGLPGLRLQINLIAVAERQAAESVPLGLVLPLRTLRQPLHQQ